MAQFVALLFLTFSLASAAHAAHDDCLFDQANQIEKLQTVAATKPSARLNVEAREVSWYGRDHTRWILVYGGCNDLGFAVTASTKQKSASNQTVVLQLANRMATEFWDRVDAAALRRATARGKFERNVDGTATFFSIVHKSYDVIQIEQRYEDGTESISVRWVRTS